MGDQQTAAESRWPDALDEVTRALESLARALDGEHDFEELLQQVCYDAASVVPGVDEVSVTLIDGDDPHTVVATSERCARLDRDQYRTGDGPCLHAARTSDLTRVSIDDARARWPEFARAARAEGFGSFLCSPLAVGERFSGAINCYSTKDHGFADLEERVLTLYATAVEAVLRAYQRYAGARQTAEQLRAALASRDVIDQAKGILMAVRGIDADEAFAVLVRQSQREHVKLREVAEYFIARVTALRRNS
jgi:transcriptional regulator with GAF, ATPase, and Fis domain